MVLSMSANSGLPEDDLVERAVAWLRERLPASWEVGRTSRVELREPSGGRAEAALDLRGPSGAYVTIAVEAKRAFGPRDVHRLQGSLGRVFRTLAGNVPSLVVSPWLSQRTQELLRKEGINYLDLTGNALLRLDNPTVIIETQGASKDPSPAPRSKARIQGPKAGRLVRMLVDVSPPYGVRDLAEAADLSPGYVSRLLDPLDDEALVERNARGRVESVDIGGLLRRWAGAYDVFKSNRATSYLVPAGVSATLPRLAILEERFAVTGSFAAVRLAAVAGPALLTAYCDDPAVIADALDLLPTDQGANVVLLQPFDPVVWERTSTDGRITYVAPSQTAIDCLTGNGRMPAEGDALVQWMTDNTEAWRLPALSALCDEVRV
jgi:DNA-binding transcriptional ArsR family regulator